MVRKENCVIVVGKVNVINCGIFGLIEYESLIKCKKTIFVQGMQEIQFRQPAHKDGHYSLAVLILSHEDFFPTWFSQFLRLNAEAKGNILIFADGFELMTQERRNLIKRLYALEYILHPAMPEAYIGHIVSIKIDALMSKNTRCNLSCREIKIIDGYVNGVSASKQASFFNISLKTLYHHRKNCANKLGLRNLKELIHM